MAALFRAAQEDDERRADRLYRRALPNGSTRDDPRGHGVRQASVSDTAQMRPPTAHLARVDNADTQDANRATCTRGCRMRAAGTPAGRTTEATPGRLPACAL